jgi:hypothetical protein
MAFVVIVFVSIFITHFIINDASKKSKYDK